MRCRAYRSWGNALARQLPSLAFGDNCPPDAVSNPAVLNALRRSPVPAPTKVPCVPCKGRGYTRQYEGMPDGGDDGILCTVCNGTGKVDAQPATEVISRRRFPNPWPPVSLSSPGAFEALMDLAQTEALPDFWTVAGAEMAKWVERVVGKLPAEAQGRVMLVTHKDRPFYYELVLGRETLSAFEVTMIAKEVSHAR